MSFLKRHMSEIIDFSKLLLVVANLSLKKCGIVECQISKPIKFKQLASFCDYICVHGFDESTNPILLKIDVHIHYTMMHV